MIFVSLIRGAYIICEADIELMAFLYVNECKIFSDPLKKITASLYQDYGYK